MWVKVKVEDDFEGREVGGKPIYQPIYHKILDHGFIGLVDWMGDDQDIVDAARVSYGRGTKKVSTNRGLIRYLLRHKHTSPTEMAQLKFHVKLPIFVARQWIRHRTGCLAGDTQLDFVTQDLKRYPVTMKKFHDLWHEKAMRPARGKIKPSYSERLKNGRAYTVVELANLVERRPEDIRQLINRGSLSAEKREQNRITDPVYFITKKQWQEWAETNFEVPQVVSRERLQRMRLRFYNEETDQIELTSVRDIWSSGIKSVYRISTEHASLRLTMDHFCLTDRGWLPLRDFVNPETGMASAKIARNRPVVLGNDHVEYQIVDEKWVDVPKTDGFYQISDYGRLRSRKSGEWKDMTLSPTNTGYVCLNIQYPDGQRTRLVHHLVLEAFGYPRESVLNECRHLNGNPSDNRLKNLKWGSPKENGEDRINHMMTTKNRVTYDEITQVEYEGEEEVYDLEVETPFHNFIANGFVVHNSFNEYSARYSVLDQEMYIPAREDAKPQSSTNKQGRDLSEITENEYNAVVSVMENAFAEAFVAYKYLLGPEKVQQNGEEFTVMPPMPENIQNRAFVWKEAAINALLKVQEDTFERTGERIEIDDAMIDAKIKEYYEANKLAVFDENYAGLARELARIVIPVAVYTQWYWSVNLHNLMHFIRLRSDEHAQKEIRVYSDKIREILEPLFPLTMEAFDEYVMGAKTFSKTEMKMLRELVSGRISSEVLGLLKQDGMTKREIEEFVRRLT